MKTNFQIYLFLLIALCSCNETVHESYPSASLSVSPLMGDTTTVFNLLGDSSSSYEDIRLGLKYFWLLDDSVRLNADETQPRAVCQFKMNGIHRIQLKVRNIWGLSDSTTSSVEVIPIRKDSFYIDPRDGRTYTTVLLNSVWWFSENLKYGKTLTYDELPSDNGIVEKYVRNQYDSNQDGYYLPEEAHQYSSSQDTSICPPGWSLPDYATCCSLRDKYLMYDDYYRPGGITGVNLDNVGYFDVDSSRFVYSSYSYWWGKGMLVDNDSHITFSLLYIGTYMNFLRKHYGIDGQSFYPEENLCQQLRFALPVRCIKKEK